MHSFKPAEQVRHPGLDLGSPEIGQSQGIAGQARNDVALNLCDRFPISRFTVMTAVEFQQLTWILRFLSTTDILFW